MTEILAAEVVAVDQVHVVIICPACGRFHQHGSNGSIRDTNYGTRVPHCGDDARGYLGEYELITTPSTTRKRKLQPHDIELWRDEQEYRRSIILEERREREAAERDRRILQAVRWVHAHGRRLTRWRIAREAVVAPHAVTMWMHARGIWYGEGRYQAISTHKAGPELSRIFGAPSRLR